jgi:G3E family GTPase
VTVPVNDFGFINIDARVIVGVKSNVIRLSAATIRDDLIETTMESIDGSERPEYILHEASAAVEPSGIMLTFTANWLYWTNQSRCQEDRTPARHNRGKSLIQFGPHRKATSACRYPRV